MSRKEADDILTYCREWRRDGVTARRTTGTCGCGLISGLVVYK